MADRPDDQADAATAGDVAPDGGTRGLLVAARFVPGFTARANDGVVVARRHGLGPEFDRLVCQRCQRNTPLRREWMLHGQCGDERLLADPLVVEPWSAGDVRREG